MTRSRTKITLPGAKRSTKQRRARGCRRAPHSPRSVRDGRCPQKPALLTKDIFCWPRPACYSNEALLANLCHLHVGTNKLSRAAAGQLAEIITRVTSLRQLGVSRTQLSHEAFEPIFGAALMNSRLSELSVDASDNELGERCARGVAEQLRRMGKTCGLCGLKMRSTSLTEGGVCALLEPLATQTSLVALDLSSNLRKKMVPWPSDAAAIRSSQVSIETWLKVCSRYETIAANAIQAEMRVSRRHW